MSNKLFVGGLPYSTSENELEELFASTGNVISTTVVSDRESGRSKGFGFVEMSSKEEASQAISQLHEKEVEGRKITVSEARERKPRNPADNSRW